MEIGAQLYTLREHCKTLPDFAATLEKVAEIGYKTVQVSGTCPWEAAWLRDELRKNGLRCVLTHTPRDRMQNDLDGVIRDHEIIGCDYIGLGFWAFDEERDMGYEKFMALWPAVARRIRQSGKYFMYHNHDREFIHLEGKPILRHLMEKIPAEDMGVTVDTFWVQSGGGDPAAWIEELSGRVPCVHLKDYAYGHSMAVLGEGNLNFDRIFQAAEKAGTKYLLVEQDDCHGEDPFDCLRRSYAYLKARGFE